ncbi:CoA-binding protein [Clostridium sp.]|uniref:CoA-binding protein n=1 Tax=Clostridium sp. TaxID=1506 RepID=UPI0039911FAD
MTPSDLISSFNKWVVIGDVSNEKKYAKRIYNKFKNSGYVVEGVHPKGGEGIYKTLEEVPFKIEAIDLCINPIDGLKYLREAKDLGIKNVLIQPGAGSEAISNYCNENNIRALDGCALVELGKLIL